MDFFKKNSLSNSCEIFQYEKKMLSLKSHSIKNSCQIFVYMTSTPIQLKTVEIPRKRRAITSRGSKFQWQAPLEIFFSPILSRTLRGSGLYPTPADQPRPLLIGTWVQRHLSPREDCYKCKIPPSSQTLFPGFYLTSGYFFRPFSRSYLFRTLPLQKNV